MKAQSVAAPRALRSRDLALVALLLAIGTVLYAFIPNFGTATPDTIVAFATLAILLVRPRPLTALGIGVIAGLLGMFFSKSPIAWFNIPTHAISAWATALVTLSLPELQIGPVAGRAAIGSLVYCLLSGGAFITGMLMAGVFPMPVYLGIAWPTVLVVTVVNTIIVLLLYPPARRLYEQNG